MTFTKRSVFLPGAAGSTVDLDGGGCGRFACVLSRFPRERRLTFEGAHYGAGVEAAREILVKVLQEA